VTNITTLEHDARLPSAPRDPATLVSLADQYNLDGPTNRLLAALAR
jgi:hypothetical protein